MTPYGDIRVLSKNFLKKVEKHKNIFGYFFPPIISEGFLHGEFFPQYFDLVEKMEYSY